MSGDWRRLHQVRGVCGGSPENHRVTRLSNKAEAGRGCLAKTVLTGLGSQGVGSFATEATRSAVAGHPFDGATKTISQSALGGHVS
jgi:hypothetical protein